MSEAYTQRHGGFPPQIMKCAEDVLQFIGAKGAVYVWRECLAATPHLVRWTHWDADVRERFGRLLAQALTAEAVAAVFVRAAKAHPRGPMNVKRGAVYAIMAIGWQVFMGRDMDMDVDVDTGG